MLGWIPFSIQPNNVTKKLYNGSYLRLAHYCMLMSTFSLTDRKVFFFKPSTLSHKVIQIINDPTLSVCSYITQLKAVNMTSVI